MRGDNSLILHNLERDTLMMAKGVSVASDRLIAMMVVLHLVCMIAHMICSN